MISGPQMTRFRMSNVQVLPIRPVPHTDGVRGGAAWASLNGAGCVCYPGTLKRNPCSVGSRAVMPGRPRCVLSRQLLAAPECDDVGGGATADVKGEENSIVEEGGEAGRGHGVELAEELNKTAAGAGETAEDATPGQPQPPQRPPPLQQQVHYPLGSGRARDYRITVPRKDICSLIGEHPKLPLKVVLRISIQGVIQEEEQRVRRDGGFR